MSKFKSPVITNSPCGCTTHTDEEIREGQEAALLYLMGCNCALHLALNNESASKGLWKENANKIAEKITTAHQMIGFLAEELFGEDAPEAMQRITSEVNETFGKAGVGIGMYTDDGEPIENNKPEELVETLPQTFEEQFATRDEKEEGN